MIYRQGYSLKRDCQPLSLITFFIATIALKKHTQVKTNRNRCVLINFNRHLNSLNALIHLNMKMSSIHDWPKLSLRKQR